MADKKKKYELEIMIAGGTDRSLEASIRRARKEIDHLEKNAGLSAQKIGDSFGGMSVKGINSLAKVSDHAFDAMVKGSKSAALGITAALGAATMTGMGFESQMSTVQAISQASEADMRKLTSLAKEMGETTQFTAEEAGQGLEYMASAGWTTQQMLDGLPGVMYLAAASGEGLALSSEIVTGALTAFGKNASEAARFADVLAQAAAASNTDVAGLGGTLEYVAPVAGALKYSYEDVAIAAGLMANANIKGEKAGTALRAALTNLAKPTEQMQGYMDDLSLSLTDSNGNIVSLRELLGDAREGFAKLSEAQKAEYAAGIAGKEGMSALLAIVNASQEDFDKLAQAIDHSTGAAQEMSKIRLNNLKGDLTILSSAAQGLGIEAYGGFSEELRKLTQNATVGIGTLTENLKENLPTIRREMKEAGESAKEWVSPILEFGEWSLDHPETIQGTIVGITGALATFKGVQTAQAGIKLLGNLSGMLSAWPVALAGVAIGGIAGVATAVKAHNKQLKKADLDKHFGDITLSMEELDQTARMIVDNGNLDHALASIEEMDKVKDLSESFQQAGKELDKLNWKIGMGFGLDEGELQDYASAVNESIQSALQIVEQSQYTTQISVQALFGKDNAAGNELIAGFDSMYASINGEVQELGRQLGDAYSAAMGDGIIDIDEARTIQELQKKLADITQQVSKAQFNAKMERIAMEYSGKELDPETFQNLQAEIQSAAAEQKAALQQSTEWSLASVELQADREGKDGQWVAERKQEIQDAFASQQMELDMSGVSFTAQSIKEAYGQELDNILPEMQEALKQAMASAMQNHVQGDEQLADWTAAQIQPWMDAQGLSDVSQKAIQDLWDTIEPQFEQLAEMKRQMEEKGEEIPQAFMESFQTAAQIGAVAGNTDAIYSLLGGMAEDETYASILSEYENAGGKVPEALGNGILNSTDSVTQAVGSLREATQAELDRQFGSFSVAGKVNVQLSASGKTGEDIPHYAKGGLIARPTLSWFAEESPEMAIPIDGSKRAMNLWKQAGELLGAYDRNNYGRAAGELSAAGAASQSYAQAVTAAPVFSPVIHIQSGENVKEQVMEGLNISYEQFVEYMERFKREQYRQAF